MLILGYGFGDYHINGAFERLRQCASPKPVAVVTFADDAEDPLQVRRDEWGWNVVNALQVNPASMGDGVSSSMVCIGDLKASRRLEASNDPRTPLKVWYNGFMEACRHPQSISDALV